MSKSIAQLTEEISDVNDRHGWWEPQCKHLSTFGMGHSEYGSWVYCSMCGGTKYIAAEGKGTTTTDWTFPKYFVERNQGELMMLFVTEVAEAYEEIRSGHKPDEVYFPTEEPTGHSIAIQKPEGVPVELADVVIRILDYCGHMNIDLEREIERKLEYNRTRLFRHGGKIA